MQLLTYVVKGHAVISPDGLRCQAPREGTPGWTCRKLIVKANRLGQIAGEFKCERCKQQLEVQLRPPSAEKTN